MRAICTLLQALLWSVLLALPHLGCAPVESAAPSGPAPQGQQELSISASAATSQPLRIVPLDDMEQDGTDHWTIYPSGPQSSLTVQDQTFHGGRRALAVTLGPKASLVLHLGGRDVSRESLLSAWVWVDRLRDDLRVELASGAGTWRTPPAILRAGWNEVRVDLQRLRGRRDVDVTDLRTVSLRFANAVDPISFVVDDVVLQDNAERITPSPGDVLLFRDGLEYRVTLPGREGTVRFSRGDDGLWRTGVHQPVLKLASPGQSLPTGGEALGLMGDRRVGQVEILEHNAIRVRLSNTWYFPSRAGEWASLGVRFIRWIHTFYAGGRWVCHVELNNAGGEPIGAVGFVLYGREAAWAGYGMGRTRIIENFIGPVGRWSYLMAPVGADGECIERNYLDPPTIQPLLAEDGVFAPGDRNRDGFDETEGCYMLQSIRGHCRFRIHPGKAGMSTPAFRIAGPWKEPPSVNVDGMAVRTVSVLGDGSALFLVPGSFTRPVMVEVFGDSSSAAPGQAGAGSRKP